MLVSAACVAVSGWAIARAIDWDRHAPAWLLIRRAQLSGNSADRDAALNEIVRRIDEGTLGVDREQTLVDFAMTLQAETTRPWVQGWGTLVEAVRSSGRLDDARWHRYLVQAVTPALQPAQPSIRPCEELNFLLGAGSARLGARYPGGRNGDVLYAAVYGVERIRIDDREVPAFLSAEISSHSVGIAPRDGLQGMGLVSISARPSTWSGSGHLGWVAPRMTGWDLSSLEPGPHTARVTLNMRLISDDSGVRKLWSMRQLRAQDSFGQDRTVEVEARWTLVPKPPLTTDPALRAGVERALKVTGARYVRGGLFSRGKLFIDLSCEPDAPVNLAFSVSFGRASNLRDGDLDGDLYGTAVYYARDVFFSHGEASVATATVESVGGMRPPTVRAIDVMLTPSPCAAPRDNSLPIWGDTMVFRDVPLRRG
jgi:hypothetical protein